MELLEMKNKISIYRVNIKLDIAEGKIGELDDIAKIYPK